MVLRSWPRCRAIAEIVQPRRWSACASTSSSRVSMRGGGPVERRVVRDQQLRRDLRHLGGATRVGKFSEQLWGDSPERRHTGADGEEQLGLNIATGGPRAKVTHPDPLASTTSAGLRRRDPCLPRTPCGWADRPARRRSWMTTRRSASVWPPQTPYGSSTVRACRRHSSSTGQRRHTCLAFCSRVARDGPRSRS
jgi:hypothetical protein